ncbi:hypothetical protein Cni_G01027 [Canna indica]|uniref:Uncharacterized protein n=1 Tax=Canna indica TaxID=4628 RepID=A0AAQ3JNW2_9LILI|nr:hypothetical protein Cni_G01027 [Canna indica]
MTMALAPQVKNDAFAEEEEALSLSDLPVAVGKDEDGECKSSDADDEFEFRILAAGGLLSSTVETEMCAADEVFFQGQILPLRPSISSVDGGFFVASRGPSRSRSRSESFDQYSAAILGLGFNSTSRSNSSGSSSSCISRSHSSNSHCSSASEHPRPSLSNNFYAHPSPTPQVRAFRRTAAGRRSASSAPPGWGVFRLGVAKAPEIELFDITSRRSNSVGGRRSIAEAEHAKKWSTKSSSSKSHEKEKKAPPRAPGGRGFSCKCAPDAVEPIAMSKVADARKKKEQEMSSKRGETMRRSRIFEWLEELSIAKATGC